MKYAPLRYHLIGKAEEVLRLSFVEIEQIIGASLPPSAREHAAWWSNNPTGHVNAQAWLEAGYRTEQVDLASEAVAFRRATKDSAPPHVGVEEAQTVQWRPSKPGPTTPKRHPAFGALAGTVKVAPGVDLTDSVGEVWDAEVQ